MKKVRWFILILAIILSLVVVLQNNHATEVRVLLHTRTLPLSVLLFTTTATGFLFGALLTAAMLRRGHSAAKKGKPAAESRVVPESKASPGSSSGSTAAP